MRLLLPLLAVLACQAAPPPAVELRSWGTMREALRGGRSEARIALTGLGAPGTVAVGALAGLEGEVTIVDDRIIVARSDGGSTELTEGAGSNAATLLVHATVPRWDELPLPDCATYTELEEAIGAELASRGFEPDSPTPVRVRGRAPRVAFHVIAGACPIATPDGTAPWRYDGALDSVELVGFFVENAAGRFTHHDRRSHLHVVAAGAMGHLDAIALEGVTLLVPAD